MSRPVKTSSIGHKSYLMHWLISRRKAAGMSPEQLRIKWL